MGSDRRGWEGRGEEKWGGGILGVEINYDEQKLART